MILMPRTTMMISRVCFGSLIIFLLGGCSVWNAFLGSEEETPAQLMEEGLANMESGYYSQASEAFQKIKDRYPYSEFASEAELKLADAAYKRALYDEAFEAYGAFEKLHPKNENLAYVIYQRGMCKYDQMAAIDRDQSPTRAAIEEFERLVNAFPNSEYAIKARKKIRACYANLAAYELYVGHFYFKQHKYRAAKGRFQYLLKNYPDVGQYHEALEYLGRCNRKIAEEQSEF